MKKGQKGLYVVIVLNIILNFAVGLTGVYLHKEGAEGWLSAALCSSMALLIYIWLLRTEKFLNDILNDIDDLINHRVEQ